MEVRVGTLATLHTLYALRMSVCTRVACLILCTHIICQCDNRQIQIVCPTHVRVHTYGLSDLCAHISSADASRGEEGSIRREYMEKEYVELVAELRHKRRSEKVIEATVPGEP